MISEYLRSVCCDAPVAPLGVTLQEFQMDCTIIRCIKCRLPIDYYDHEIKLRLDQMSIMDEWVIRQPTYTDGPKQEYPRGTLQERRAYWDSYMFLQHERMFNDIRKPDNPFIYINVC